LSEELKLKVRECLHGAMLQVATAIDWASTVPCKEDEARRRKQLLGRLKKLVELIEWVLDDS
jgi:hypothetical protein